MGSKKKASDGPQTLKQAKAAFKARGSTTVSTTERRQLERGAVLLERAERTKEQEQRRKDLSKKKADKEAKVLKSCAVPSLFGTQRRLDRFGHKSSQFHLGAFLKPKPTVPAAPVAKQQRDEPWEDDDVDDDTLLDLAAESPVALIKTPAKVPSQPTPSKARKIVSCTTDDFASWDDFLERSSQLARELATEQKTDVLVSPMPPPKQSFARIPSFNSTDFDLSVDDLEELDLLTDGKPLQSKSGEAQTLLQLSFESVSDHVGQRNVQHSPGKSEAITGKEFDRELMPPPPLKMSAKQRPRAIRSEIPAPSTCVQHGISLADLESLAGEDIQLSQFNHT